MLIFVAWWAAFLGATALLVGWQWRLARRRAAIWEAQVAYALAVATSAAVTALVFVLGALLLALFPPAPVGRGLGILGLVAWGLQCRERWAALAPDASPPAGRPTGASGWRAGLSRARGGVAGRAAPHRRGRG